MALTASPRRKPRENQFFDLGVRGRKTGLTLPDTGIRDEHGMEPLDNLFSSPEKAKSTKSVRNTARKNASAMVNATMSDEEDMDIGNSTVPEPQNILTERKRSSMKMPLPRSKSPIKTHLQSPARRNPSLGPTSPTRASIEPQSAPSAVASVRRRLDFSMNEGSSVSRASPLATAQRSSRLVNGTRLHPPPNLAEYSDDDPYNADDIPESDEAQQQLIDDNGSYAMMDDEGPAQSDDSIPPVPRASASKKTKGKQKAVVDAPVSVSPIVPTQKGKRGRPKKQVASQDVDDQDEPRPAKRSKQAAAPKSPVAKKGKGPSKVTKPQTTRKAQLASITEDDASSPQIKPRPPIPRSNRGLYIYRRETPSEVAGYKQTRSGRTSIKPLSWWAGERVEYDDTTIKDGNRNILVHQIKEVVRADEVEPRHRAKSAKTTTKSKSKSKKSTHDASIDEDPDFVDTDLMEAWEFEPGRIDGFLRDWNPADPSGQESQESQQLIAYAAAAINTRQVKNATFGFAKTMTMPFFGAGVVDLPPGAVKKVKNTRRMHMVFFLHYGRVEAMVNDNTFRIGQGGQWMVPRGNFYSITNDYDKPARIFFCQANELDDVDAAAAAATRAPPA